MRHLLFAVIVALTLCSCGVEGLVEFLHEQPKSDRLPGAYVLNPTKYSYAALKSDGYSDLNAVVRLKSDGSFAATRLPDCCVYLERGHFGGYFDGEGTWTVETKDAVFNIRLRFSKMRREGRADIKQPQSYDTASFTITKDGASYGLAAPLWDGGDFIYVYFQKRKEG